MTHNRMVFCEIAFWEKFSGSYPVSMPLPDERELKIIKTWIEFYELLSRSEVHVDCNVSEFVAIAEKDPKLFHLWKRSAGGNSRFEFDGPFSLEQTLSSSLFSVLLTGTGKAPLAKHYGIISINGGNWHTKGRLFVDNGINIRVNEQWNWQEFAVHFPELASNSMVIVDNYILKNGKHDLPKLLDLLLPESCEVEYHLTIFSLPGRLTKDDIEKIIQAKKPRLADHLFLEIIPVTGSTEFHDRAIITNNLWLFVGGGFDLTRIDRTLNQIVVSRSTTIEIVYPFFAKTNMEKVDDAYENLIRDAQVCLEHSRMHSKNRLLVE